MGDETVSQMELNGFQKALAEYRDNPRLVSDPDFLAAFFWHAGYFEVPLEQAQEFLRIAEGACPK